MAAELDALVKVAPENPAKPTEVLMPSIFNNRSTASFTTSSVRDKEAPAGDHAAREHAAAPR